jgi:hypothetical protein
MEAHADFELSISPQSKPLPYGPLATAIYINSNRELKSPIEITSASVSPQEPTQPAAAVKLVHKKEYLFAFSL